VAYDLVIIRKKLKCYHIKSNLIIYFGHCLRRCHVSNFNEQTAVNSNLFGQNSRPFYRLRYVKAKSAVYVVVLYIFYGADYCYICCPLDFVCEGHGFVQV